LRTNLVRGGVIAAIAGAAIIGVAAAANGAEANGVSLTNVPTANEKAEGYAPASRLSPELQGRVLAQGSTLVENPSALTSTYGCDNDVTTAGGFPQMVPTKTNPNTEAQKTEPDKNTYLVLKTGLTGADASYNYGARFLFQGHEGGVGGNSYITRINMDADAAHKVTLLATKDASGNAIKTIDGSTWEPFAERLLFTTESASNPTYAATPVTRRSSPTSPAHSGAAVMRASRTTATATSGSLRTSGALSRRTALERARQPSVRTASSTGMSRRHRATSPTASYRCFRC
jgi:hypothetical protein